MSSFSPYFVKLLIRKIFPVLRKTQQVNLAFAVIGSIKGRSAILSVMVRSIPGARKHKHRLKRLWRFVSNHRVKPERLSCLWIAWCIKTFVPWDYVPIALDWTSLPGNIPCLMAAIPFHGRAIPLLWQVVPFGSLKDSQNRIEERLVAQLVRLIPAGKQIVLVADRGFGRATFVRFLLAHRLLFVLRVRADVIVTTNKGKKRNARRIRLQPDIPRWFPQITYRNDGVVSGINLCAVVTKDSDDPWILVTNLRKPTSTIARYASRFQIEEWFKDMKHELGIADIRTKDLKRIRRMVFLSCVSYGITLLIGTLAQRFSTWRDQLVTGGKACASRIWFALRIIEYHLAPSFFWYRVWRKGRGT